MDPSSERFAGDIRVLSRLIEREHEAHTALGDAASLMGRYSVTGEEDVIRSVLAGEKDLDEVVRTPGEVAAGDDLTGLFARLFEQPTAPTADPEAAGNGPGGSGLYPDEISYLEEALHAGFLDLSQPLSNGGVRWRRDGTSVPPNSTRRPTCCKGWRCCRSPTSPSAASPSGWCWRRPESVGRTDWGRP